MELEFNFDDALYAEKFRFHITKNFDISGLSAKVNPTIPSQILLSDTKIDQVDWKFVYVVYKSYLKMERKWWELTNL